MMRPAGALAALLLLGGVTLPAAARDPVAAALPPGVAAVTLAEAEARLVERNLAVIAARRGVDAARAQRLVASALPPPTVSIGSTVAQFNETARNGLQGARFLPPSNNIAVGLSVLVERGGKRTLRTRLAEEQIGVAEAQVLDLLRLQLFELRRAFLGGLLARANLEVALANRESLDRTEALLRRQLRDGAIAEGELLRFQASRIAFEGDIPANAQAYAAGVAAVAALLAADAAAIAARPAAGALRGILPGVAFDLAGRLDRPLPPLGLGREELGAAVASRADVVAAQRQASAAAANRALAEAGRTRDVTLDTSWGRTRLSQDLPESTRGQVSANNVFGLGVSIPIFTGRIVEGNLGIAAAQQAQAELGAQAALLGARAEFAAAWAAWEQARTLLALYAGGALARAEAAFRSTEQAYAAGGRSLLDVLDALRTLNATRSGANQARHAALLALAALEQASGVSGIAPRL